MVVGHRCALFIDGLSGRRLGPRYYVHAQRSEGSCTLIDRDQLLLRLHRLARRGATRCIAASHHHRHHRLFTRAHAALRPSANRGVRPMGRPRPRSMQNRVVGHRRSWSLARACEAPEREGCGRAFNIRFMPLVTKHGTIEHRPVNLLVHRVMQRSCTLSADPAGQLLDPGFLHTVRCRACQIRDAIYAHLS